jgi:5-methyltetrahydropteroyltriglutamate--homocysteine methyltransferase
MCYSNFNDIIQSIINMDAKVITNEKLLSVSREGMVYGAGIGPGVYDIHSPRIPSKEEITDRINKMLVVLETNILWVGAIVHHALLAHQNDTDSSPVWLPGRPSCAST